MINKIKIKPCASLPGQGVKMSNVSQNGGLHGTWWSWIFMWPKTLFQVYIQIIWTTVWYQILIFRILKLLDLQNIAQLKRKRKLIMGAEFVTFDNAVNAMACRCYAAYYTKVRLIWLYSKTFYVFFITCGLSAVRIIGRKLRYMS